MRGIEEKKYNQEAVWTNSADGIITQLRKHEAFAGVTWPQSHMSIIQTIDNLLLKNKHLYTSGLEQAKPAAAGTEGTKAERALTPLDQVL